MHYDTFGYIKADPTEFVRKVEAKGLKAVVVCTTMTADRKSVV